MMFLKKTCQTFHDPMAYRTIFLLNLVHSTLKYAFFRTKWEKKHTICTIFFSEVTAV